MNVKSTYHAFHSIDTGSSNTWCGADQSNPYKKSSAGKDTGNTVQVSYGSGSFSGEEVTDTIVLGGSLTVTNQGIGAAKTSQVSFHIHLLDIRSPTYNFSRI